MYNVYKKDEIKKVKNEFFCEMYIKSISLINRKYMQIEKCIYRQFFF